MTRKTDVSALLTQVLERRRAGQFGAAQDLVRQARTLAAALEDRVLAANVLVLDGVVRQDLGDLDGAERALSEAVAVAGESCGAEATRLQVRARGLVGSLRRVQGRYDDAERELRMVLELAMRELGPDSLEVATALNDLAVTFKFSGNHEEAEQLYLRALAILEAKLGPEHEDVATIYHNLGGLAHARGDFVAAETHARLAVEIREKVLGADHLAVAADRGALAPILDALGRHSEAESLLRQALAVFERAHGPEHYEIAIVLNNLAAIAHRQGVFSSAESLYRRALAIKEKVLGREHPELAATLNNLGLIHRAHERLRDAEKLFARAVAILEATVEPTHPTLDICRRKLRVYPAIDDLRDEASLRRAGSDHGSRQTSRERWCDCTHPRRSTSTEATGRRRPHVHEMKRWSARLQSVVRRRRRQRWRPHVLRGAIVGAGHSWIALAARMPDSTAP